MRPSGSPPPLLPDSAGYAVSGDAWTSFPPFPRPCTVAATAALLVAGSAGWSAGFGGSRSCGFTLVGSGGPEFAGSGICLA